MLDNPDYIEALSEAERERYGRRKVVPFGGLGRSNCDKRAEFWPSWSCGNLGLSDECVELGVESVPGSVEGALGLIGPFPGHTWIVRFR